MTVKPRRRMTNASLQTLLTATLLLSAGAAAGLGGDLASIPRDLDDVSLASAAAGLGGQLLWEARYDGPVSGSDWGRDVAVHPTGLIVYVTGNSQQSATGGAEFATIAYEALTGLPLWEARYDGSGGDADFPSAIRVDPDGTRVYVAGYSGTFGALEYAVVAYDALTGLQLWEATYADEAGQNVAYDLAVAPDGSRVYVTGGAAGTDSPRDIVTLAFDALTGDRIWQDRYAGQGGGVDIAWALTTDHAGDRVYVTGQARAESQDMATIALDAETGQRIWVALHDGPAALFDNAFDVKVHPDDHLVYVGGYTNHDDQSNDLTVIAYDTTNGQEVWIATYDSGAQRADYANALAVDPDGARVYATGYSWGGSETRADWGTLAFDAETGETQWVTRYDGPDNGLDAGEALVTSPDGERLYVTGYSQGTDTGRDYAVAAYDAATGEELWLERYDGGAGGTDHPRAIAVDPLELRVYVTGNSWGGSHNEFATLAYLDVR